jgi:fibronectin-binding autotransporter adhesin
MRLHAGSLFAATLASLVSLAASAHAQSGPFVYVPNEVSGSVSVIDTPTNTVAGSTISVGSVPSAAAARGDESLVYVANSFSNEISVINTAANTVTAAIPVGNAGSTTVLTGANTYTGGTGIGPGATLQLGNGGASGSIVGDVANGGTLIFNRSDSYTFAGAISNIGSLQQNGTGTTNLTGVNTYGGTTTVNAGTLESTARSPIRQA